MMSRPNASLMTSTLLTAALAAASCDDLAAAEIMVDASRVLCADFRGIGTNAGSPKDVDDATWDAIFAKRLRESARDGFTRIFVALDDWAPTPSGRRWDAPSIVRLERQLALLQRTGGDVYLTSAYWAERPLWMGHGIIRDDAVLKEWATAQVDLIERLVRTRGFTCVKYWCMTNECSSGDDKDGFDRIEVTEVGGQKRYTPVNMPLFERHHRAVADELHRRGLDGAITLIATDALGRVDAWRGSIPYAAEHMGDITGGWVVHDYAHGGGFGIPHPDTQVWTQFADECGVDWLDAKYYDQALARYRWGRTLPKAPRQPFFIGELGGRGAGGEIPNGHLDRGPHGAEYGVYLVDRIAAALNAGLSGVAQWHLYDFEQVYGGGWTYRNEWGLWEDAAHGFAVRPEWYAYATAARFLRRGAILGTTCDAPRVHAAAVRQSAGPLAVLVVNGEDATVPITITLVGMKPPSRLAVHAFEIAKPPRTINGDLPPRARAVATIDGTLHDRLPAHSFAIYTDDGDDQPPAAVAGVQTTRRDGAVTITWTAVGDHDLAYYRIWRGTEAARTQIGSTVATTWRAAGDDGIASYAVTAVDLSGNESR